MSDKLKLRLLKISKVGLKVGAGLMIGSGLMAYGMQFLPPETYQEVMTMLNSSKEAMATYGISSTLFGGGILTLQQGLKLVSGSIDETDLRISAMETNLKKQVNKGLEIHSQVDERVVNELNKQNALLQKQIKQNNIIIGFNSITAQRNIAMSDDIMPQEIKNQYKTWLSELKTIDYDIKPITKVVEVKETIIKEVEVAKKQVKKTW